MSELVLYTSNDGRTRLDLRIEGRTAWLTQLEIAELFQTTKQNVSLHAKNIFEDGELAQDSVVKESSTTAADGKAYNTKLYNLDLILAIGYRVRKQDVAVAKNDLTADAEDLKAIEGLEKDLKRKGGKA